MLVMFILHVFTVHDVPEIHFKMLFNNFSVFICYCYLYFKMSNLTFKSFKLKFKKDELTKMN